MTSTELLATAERSKMDRVRDQTLGELAFFRGEGGQARLTAHPDFLVDGERRRFRVWKFALELDTRETRTRHLLHNEDAELCRLMPEEELVQRVMRVVMYQVRIVRRQSEELKRSK